MSKEAEVNVIIIQTHLLDGLRAQPGSVLIYGLKARTLCADMEN